MSMDRNISKHCHNTEATKRWICFIAAIWLQSINGTNFIFSLYSSDLKKVMAINQIKLNNLAVASDLGKIMGWVSGAACMHLPSWAVLGIATSLGTVGYGVQWLMLTQKIHSLEYWQVYILCFLAGNSICWFNTVSFKATIENFPTQRGIASGLTTSYSGLSAVIYTCLSALLVPGDPSSYLLLNCVVPAIVAAISAILLHLSQSKSAKEDEAESRNMNIFTVIAITTAIYAIVFEFIPHEQRQREGIYISILILLLIAPLCIPLKLSFGLQSINGKVSNYSSGPIESPGNIGANSEKPSEEKATTIAEKHPSEIKNCKILDIELGSHLQTVQKCQILQPKSPTPLGQEHGILQLLASVDFWLYYMVYFCGGTVGLVYINNLGQILESLGEAKTSTLVSLVSSFGFFGRIASGFPDYFQQWRMTRTWKYLPRTAWLGLWMVPMVMAFFMLAVFDAKGSIVYLSTAIVGTSSGAITTIAIPISSELFGLERFGVNHNILITNIAVGSLVFGQIAGIIYNDSRSIAENRRLCMGTQCYEKTFLIWGSVCSFGIVLCVVLCARTRELYQSIHTHRQNQNG